jgi:Sulfotransferase family
VKPAETSQEGRPPPPFQTPTGGQSPGGKESPFHVPPLLHVLGGLVHHYRDFWLWLGRLESSLLAQELRQVPITMPIYVSGLARSGSTLLHEVVSAHPGVATHRIKDYPMVFTPYWWRRSTAHLRPKVPRQRPHQDRVMITTDSPDSIEEMLWMAFFPHCHDPTVSNLLGAAESHPAFESFYHHHVRKLLLAEKAARYAAKANYHVARLPYLVRLFPDAKFLIPIRAPASHIASLMRQHRLFSEGQRKQPRSLAFMQRSGHFEFGRDRRPMNLGDSDRIRQILHAFAAGDEVRGQALYWDMVYGYLARLLASDAQVRAAVLVVPFEKICVAPEETLRAVLGHCGLPDAERIVQQYAPAISYPTYYQGSFSPTDLDLIREETAATASLWGY